MCIKAKRQHENTEITSENVSAGNRQRSSKSALREEEDQGKITLQIFFVRVVLVALEMYFNGSPLAVNWDCER